MSSITTPISPARFAAALPALPLSSLHGKGAELRNSIEHLEKSNQELRTFADEGDRDCAEAIEENKEVMIRLLERIELLRAEVENRGYMWSEQYEEPEVSEHGGVNMEGIGSQNNARAEDVGANGTSQPATDQGRVGGRFNDHELASMLRERMEDGDDDNPGIHL